MAGTNGPTSLGGTPDTPNPQGGAQPSDTAPTDPKRKNAGTDKPPQDKPAEVQNEDG